MGHLDVHAQGAAVLGDLHQTARVAGGDDPRARLADSLGLAPPEVAGDLGLEQVVHPRAPAAKLAVLEVDEGHARDAPQQLPRLGPYALAMRQVAGVVI